MGSGTRGCPVPCFLADFPSSPLAAGTFGIFIFVHGSSSWYLWVPNEDFPNPRKYFLFISCLSCIYRTWSTKLLLIHLWTYHLPLQFSCLVFFHGSFCALGTSTILFTTFTFASPYLRQAVSKKCLCSISWKISEWDVLSDFLGQRGDGNFLTESYCRRTDFHSSSLLLLKDEATTECNVNVLKETY